MTTRAQGEFNSFIHLVEEPHEGRASVYYCLPLWDGADQSIRRFIRYPIQAPPWSAGERPFWVNLATVPLGPGFARAGSPHLTLGAHYATRTPKDRLLFIVDRNVVVGDPEPRSVSIGTGRDGSRYDISPDVAFRRVQHRQAIPQSNGGEFGSLSPSQVAVRDIGGSVSAPDLVVDLNRDVYPFSQVQRAPGQDAAALGRFTGSLKLVVVESPRTDGGVLISFLLRWRYRGSAVPEFQDPVIAEVELAVQDPKRPAAWFYEVGPRRVRNRYPVRFSYLPTNLSVTVRARLGLIGLTPDWEILELARRDLLQRAPPRLPYVDLRLRRDGPRVVPRPQAPLRGNTFPYTSPVHAEAGMSIENLEDTAVPRAMLDLVVGLTPVVGDLVDIGELVLALSTGRDRWGEEISSLDLLLMGIGAVVPLVSSSGLRLVGRADELARAAGRTVRDSWGSAENFVRHFRPLFLQRLQEEGNLRRLAARSLRATRPLQQLRHFVNDVVTETDLRVAQTLSEQTSMTGVRDLETARQLGILRRP